MAKDVSGAIWKFDAAGQAEGYGPSLDSGPGVTHTVNFSVPLNIKEFKVITGGTGGDVLKYSRKIVGTEDPTQFPRCNERKRYEVLFLDETAANDTLSVPYDKTVDGIYIQTLPSGAVIYVTPGE